MQIIFVALAITFTAVLTVPLAVVAIGIRRQERACSLSIRPRGRTAAVTRKLLDLHAAPQASNPGPGRSDRAETSGPLQIRGDLILTSAAAMRAQP